MNSNYLEQEGYDLMGAVFEVYKEQGHGLSEEIYQESLELELGWSKIPYTSKGQLAVYYKGQQLKKKYIPDLLVFSEIVTELKTVKKLTPEHEQQLLNYMNITQKAVGYLINFSTPKSVEWKRYILSEFIPD
jgi:GxxExxY protein